MVVLGILALYAALANLLAFVLFGIDKRRAAAGAWRIRESTLLAVALLGGWPGAKAGQRAFRHKTRKQPFARRLDAAGALLLGLLLTLGALSQWPAGRAGLARASEAVGEAISLPGGTPGPEGSAPGPSPRRFGPGSGGDL